MSDADRRGTAWPSVAAAVLAFGAIALALWRWDDPSDAALFGARYTARVSFGFFLAAYLTGPLAVLRWSPRWLGRDGWRWLVAFAVAHAIHLGALIRYFVVSNAPPELPTLIGGSIGYGVLLAMVVGGTDRIGSALGQWRDRLQTAGLHYIWIVFAFSYFGRLFDPARRVQGVVGSLLAVAALGIRLVAARRRA